MEYKDFIRYWLPLLLYAGLIFYMSSIAVLVAPGFAPEFRPQDKIHHVFEFFILAYLVLRLLLFYKVKNAYVYAIVVSTLYGVTDEIHQLFVHGRFFSYLDMVANLVGSFFVIFFRKR